MKAAVLHSFDEPLSCEVVPEPELKSGAAIVRVEAAFVPGDMLEFTRGRVPFPVPTPPYIPGTDAIGVVEAVADDVYGLDVGQRVYCDDYVTLPGAPGLGGYVGLTAPMPGAEAVLKLWPNGCYAERFALPAECFIPLGDAGSLAPAMLSRLGYLGTSYQAMLRGNFSPGQIAVVNGATGVLGVGTVMLLLTLGAARVVVLGRRKTVLERLQALDAKRVSTVAVTDAALDANTIREAAGDPADLFLDAIGFTENPATTVACIDALGVDGHAVLMGGLNAPVPIDYATQMIGRKLSIYGSEWFPRGLAERLLRMIGTGFFDLSKLSAHTFPLHQAQSALEAAASADGGFEHVVILPQTATEA